MKSISLVDLLNERQKRLSICCGKISIKIRKLSAGQVFSILPMIKGVINAYLEYEEEEKEKKESNQEVIGVNRNKTLAQYVIDRVLPDSEMRSAFFDLIHSVVCTVDQEAILSETAEKVNIIEWTPRDLENGLPPEDVVEIMKIVWSQSIEPLLVKETPQAGAKQEKKEGKDEIKKKKSQKKEIAAITPN